MNNHIDKHVFGSDLIHNINLVANNMRSLKDFEIYLKENEEVFKDIFTNLEKLKELFNHIDELMDLVDNTDTLIALHDFLKNNKVLIVVNSYEEMLAIPEDYTNAVRIIYDTEEHDKFLIEDYVYRVNPVTEVGSWVKVFSNDSMNNPIAFAYSYNNGEAKGGEKKISLPKTVVDVIAIYLNGLRNLPETLGSFDDKTKVFSLKTPLEKNDDVVFIFSEGAISFINFIKIQNDVKESLEISKSNRILIDSKQDNLLFFNSDASKRVIKEGDFGLGDYSKDINIAPEDREIDFTKLRNGFFNIRGNSEKTGFNYGSAVFLNYTEKYGTMLGIESVTRFTNPNIIGYSYRIENDEEIGTKFTLLTDINTIIDENGVVHNKNPYSSMKKLITRDNISEDTIVNKDTKIPSNKAVINYVKERITYLTPEMFGAVSDGKTDDSVPIKLARAEAIKQKTYVLCSGEYLVNEDFKVADPYYRGKGSFILPDGNTWLVTNTGDHENIIYVGGTTAGNSGSTKNKPVPLYVAMNIIKSFSDRVLDGYYVIEFLSGVHKFRGERLYNLPVFVKYLRIRGESVAMNTQPTTVWDGTDSVEPYAFLGQNPQSFPYRIEVSNMFLKNWYRNGSPNTGFMVLWQEATVYAKNMWFDNCSFGISIRQGYCQALGGKAYNTRSVYAIAYNAVGNIGSLNKEHSIYMENCDFGIEIGRGTILYAQNVYFKECGVDISCTRLSRFRSQACTHDNWKISAYALALNSVQTPDNGAGYPDKFIHKDVRKQVLTMQGLSTHLHIQRYNVNNAISEGVINVPTNTELSMLTSFSDDVRLGSTFVPFRIPKYLLLTVGSQIRFTFTLGNFGVGGKIEVHGQGSSRSSVFGEINIIDERVTRECEVIIRSIGGGQLYTTVSIGTRSSFMTTNMHSSKAFHDETWLLGRIYVSTTENKDIPYGLRFSNIRSYVEM